jgi:hypothetical protein
MTVSLFLGLLPRPPTRPACSIKLSVISIAFDVNELLCKNKFATIKRTQWPTRSTYLMAMSKLGHTATFLDAVIENVQSVSRLVADKKVTITSQKAEMQSEIHTLPHPKGQSMPEMHPDIQQSANPGVSCLQYWLALSL